MFGLLLDLDLLNFRCFANLSDWFALNSDYIIFIFLKRWCLH